MFINELNVAAPFADLLATLPGETPDWLQVRPIDPQIHARFVTAHSESFLQTPEWAGVKPAWGAENLGWYEGDELVGAALVLYRPVPGSRRSLAYVPEGPALPWATVGTAPARWLEPFIAHLRRRKAFAVRIGPTLPVRVWHAPTAKSGLADAGVSRFDQLAADETSVEGEQLATVLAGRGWEPIDRGPGFGSGQPRFGLRIDLGGRTRAELLAGTNQQWRRNVTRATKAGVVVREGGADDLPVFHRLYRETAERDGFTPRPASYFTGMWDAMTAAGPGRLRVYVAECGDEPLASALVVQVGAACWYSYGASSARNRQAQASTALQWHAICAALDRGCDSYDMRGIADTLDPQDPLAGLVRFKLGTGGDCVETVGEWELTLSAVWHQAYRIYQKARS